MIERLNALNAAAGVDEDGDEEDDEWTLVGMNWKFQISESTVLSLFVNFENFVSIIFVALFDFWVWQAPEYMLRHEQIV